MRCYPITAAILACALPATAVLAEDVPQPSGTPTTSTAPQYGEGTWQSTLLSQDVQGALGKEVWNGAGENLGRIVDILVDKSGQVRAAVMDFGGFLGVGSRKIVVDWGALHFASGDQGNQITADFTRDQVKEAHEYKTGKPVVTLGSKD
jgi:PRC-barrel domain